MSTATERDKSPSSTSEPQLAYLLKELLTAYRVAADPRDFGWRAHGRETAGRKSGKRVNHRQLAGKMGKGLDWYVRRETGRMRFTTRELEQVADLLHMTWRARVALYRRALRCEPHPGSAATAFAAGNPSWARELLVQPRCVVDASFTLLDYNEPFVNLVRVGKRRLSHANLMELLLLEEVTRDRWADWENWLEALAAELIEATALHWEESPELQRLHTSVLADPVVGPVYKRSAGYMFPDRNRKLPIRNLLPGVQEITFLHTEDDLSR